MTTGAKLAVAACAALLSTCTQEKSSSDDAIRAYVRDVTGDDLKGSGRLQVSTNDVTSDGRFAKVRGLVQNKFDDTVYGIRYVVTIYEYGQPATGPGTLATRGRHVHRTGPASRHASGRLEHVLRAWGNVAVYDRCAARQARRQADAAA